MGGIEIRVLRRGDAQTAAQWDAFVRSHKTATFFHLSGWQRVIEETFGHRTHFLYAVDTRQSHAPVVGVLPLAHVRSLLFGSALTGLPFAVYGGVVADSEIAQAALIDAAQSLAHDLSVDHLELRHRQACRPDWPQQDLYVTFRGPIRDREEDNLLAIPRKQRAMIRKGIKHGLVSEIDTDSEWGVDRFFALYADNVHRHGTPALPRRYFRLLRQVFGPDVEVLTVSDPLGTPLSSVLSFYFRDEVLPYYAGDCVQARTMAANDFKYWELLRRACLRGLRTFDYGRSKRGTGSYDFKCNWGFEPEPLHYEYLLLRRQSVPQHNPSNARYRLLIQGWRRLPLGVANWLGPHLVKSLG